MTAWLLVANSSSAYLYANHGQHKGLELVHALEAGLTSNSYARLVLVASDPFIGKLHK